jgi:SMC interacting uncharacterized protein involved in chromosome segregation
MDMNELNDHNKKLKIDLSESKSINDKLKLELAEINGCFILLREQNERLHSSSASVTMKLAEKASTVNNTNNTVVINTNQLTNEVLRQCANTSKWTMQLVLTE